LLTHFRGYRGSDFSEAGSSQYRVKQCCLDSSAQMLALGERFDAGRLSQSQYEVEKATIGTAYAGGVAQRRNAAETETQPQNKRLQPDLPPGLLQNPRHAIASATASLVISYLKALSFPR
jgi:hypothetical protein